MPCTAGNRPDPRREFGELDTRGCGEHIDGIDRGGVRVATAGEHQRGRGGVECRQGRRLLSAGDLVEAVKDGQDPFVVDQRGGQLDAVRPATREPGVVAHELVDQPVAQRAAGRMPRTKTEQHGYRIAVGATVEEVQDEA